MLHIENSFEHKASVQISPCDLPIASLFLLILEGGTIEGLALTQEEVFSSYHVYSLVTGILLHLLFATRYKQKVEGFRK